MRKKLLALLLAAALALGLLAGCGGESVASALLKLLDGRYPNISVEMDPDLEAELRRAISQAESENAGDDAAVIRAALETALGSDITFRFLGDGQKGETAFDLVFYAGSDPDKAAQAAYSQWNLVFSNVPGDGQYDTSLAMVETNSGVWMLVKATVEKAGRPDKDDEPDPVILEKLSVTAPTGPFYAGGTFSPAGMVVTATYSDGSTKTIDLALCSLTINGTNATDYVFGPFGIETITIKVEYNGKYVEYTTAIQVADKDGYHEDGNTYIVTGTNGLHNLFNNVTGDFADKTIQLESPVTIKENTRRITFAGTLIGKNEDTLVTIEGGSQGLFAQIGYENNNSGTVQDVDIEVGTIQSYTETSIVGAVAGKNYGIIENCNATGGTIQCTSSINWVGGIAGINHHKVTGCTVTGIQINGFCDFSGGTIAGGIVARNYGSIENCHVTGGTQIKAHGVSGEDGTFYAGGVVGYNEDTGTIDRDCTIEGSTTISGGGDGYANVVSVGGVVGYNASDADSIPDLWKGSYENITAWSESESNFIHPGKDGTAEKDNCIYVSTRIGQQTKNGPLA